MNIPIFGNIYIMVKKPSFSSRCNDSNSQQQQQQQQQTVTDNNEHNKIDYLYKENI